ncbi:MAG: glycosyltransferase family 4 protein [Gammaproteobacteria bacterium]|nr:glycosyltransferase family 4 protein [Gammaproteobacteria bacterium]
MKILLASMMPTHPTTVGNRARILNLCTALKSLGHDLHFAYIRREPGDLAAMARFHGEDRMHVADYRQPAARSSLPHKLWRRTQAALRRDAAFTVPVDDWYDPALDDYFERLQRRHAFDAVVVEYVFLSRALLKFGGGTLKILDTHDVFTNRHREYVKAGLWPGWYSTTLDEELKALRRADVVLTIQERESVFFRNALPGARIVTVGHISEVAPPIVDWRARTANSLLFVGNDNVMNTSGLDYFTRRVLPRVRRAIPDAHLRVAGSASAAIRSGAGVEKLGYVEDLGATYRTAWLALNPVRAGTGLAIKSVEALSHALPLVTTRTGSRGLEGLDARAFVEVPDDDAGAMATAIIDLLSNESRRTAASAAAAAAIRRAHDADREAISAALQA